MKYNSTVILQAKSNVITYKPNLIANRSGGDGTTYQPDKVDYLAYHLWGTLDSLTPAGIISSANSYINIRDGVNEFYTRYPRSETRQIMLVYGYCTNRRVISRFHLQFRMVAKGYKQNLRI